MEQRTCSCAPKWESGLLAILLLYTPPAIAGLIVECKIAIAPGGLFLNAAFFKDLRLLTSQESVLPIDTMEATIAAVARLLKDNRMDVSADPRHTPDQLIVNTWILQVQNGVFRAGLVGVTDEAKDKEIYVLKFKVGIPHGFGDAIEKATHAAAADPRLVARIAANPKQELLKMLEEKESCARAK